MNGADLSRTFAIVPVRSLGGAKSRLGEPLDAEERADLVMALLTRTVEAALAAKRLAGVIVVSMDEELLGRARNLGAMTLLQKIGALNEGLDEARSMVGGAVGAQAKAIVVLPADLPGVTASAIDRLVEAAQAAASAEPERAVVVLVTDRHGSGTNALLTTPPDAIPFRFGPGSRESHRTAASLVGATYVELDGPLSFDLDTADDLLEADRMGLDHEAGR